MITKRDQDLFNFIEEFHIATSKQVEKLFFDGVSGQYTRIRLKQLFEYGLIKRTKSTIDNCFAYYIGKKPVQLHHDLIRSELYTTIKGMYNLLNWTNEAPIANIRPDALCYIDNHGIVFPVIIEVHLGNKFNFDKYKDIDFKSIFGILPYIIICTDRRVTIPASGNKFRLIGLDMSGLDSLFKAALFKANKSYEGVQIS